MEAIWFLAGFLAGATICILINMWLMIDIKKPKPDEIKINFPLSPPKPRKK